MQHHELIESKAFAASNRARFWPADGQAAAAQIENGDLVAKPVHLDDESIRERAQRGQVHSSMASHPPCIYSADDLIFTEVWPSACDANLRNRPRSRPANSPRPESAAR